MYRQNGVVLPPLDLAVAVLVLSFLVTVVTAGTGAILSIKANSMRQVYQAMSVTWMLLIFGFSFGAKALLDRLPKEMAEGIVRGVMALGSPEHRGGLVGGASLVLGGIGLILFSAAEKRFKRLRCVPR